MLRLPSLAEAEDALARAIGRHFPPRSTAWQSKCMTCQRVYSIALRPFDQAVGAEAITTGLCDDCLDDETPPQPER